MRKIISLALLFICMVSVGSNAQKVWTLQECIDYALTNNIQLQKNKIASQSAKQDVLGAKAAWLPSLSFSSNQSGTWRPWSSQTISLTNGTMSTTQSQTTYNGSYSLSGNWTVWNGGRIQKNIEKSKYTEKIADLTTQETANSIQEQIVQLYVQILYENEALKIDSANIKMAELQLNRARERQKIGALAKVDVTQLEAQLTQDQYQLVNTNSQLENYKLQLKQLLEIHGEESFNVSVPQINDDEVLKVVPTKSEIYQTALNLRPEIESGKLSIESAKFDKKIAKTGLYPTITANAGIGSNHTSGLDNGAFKQLKNNLSNTIGLTLSVPIFDQRQTKTSVQKAELSIQNTELELESTRKQLYSSVENYWLNATTGQQQYRAAKVNVKSMQESYDLVSEQFRLGLKNIVELTTGKTNLLQAQGQMLQSKYTAVYNLSMLRFYQGQQMSL